mmetsp:Transcript_55329/g.99636  ORF Transcript_55329/g.99636 Transcript_55329/m.99636 type:complete len:85 (+) Transcript_55329:120-374(+)
MSADLRVRAASTHRRSSRARNVATKDQGLPSPLSAQPSETTPKKAASKASMTERRNQLDLPIACLSSASGGSSAAGKAAMDSMA